MASLYFNGFHTPNPALTYIPFYFLSAIVCPWLDFGLPPRCPQVVWCHWVEIEPFSDTLAQDGLAECDQPGKNPLKYSAVAGNWTRATGRTDSELFHWAIMTELYIPSCPHSTHTTSTIIPSPAGTWLGLGLGYLARRGGSVSLLSTDHPLLPRSEAMGRNNDILCNNCLHAVWPLGKCAAKRWVPIIGKQIFHCAGIWIELWVHRLGLMLMVAVQTILTLTVLDNYSLHDRK